MGLGVPLLRRTTVHSLRERVEVGHPGPLRLGTHFGRSDEAGQPQEVSLHLHQARRGGWLVPLWGVRPAPGQLGEEELDEQREALA